MYQAIKHYCENEKNNGLYLIDMPTGFGKTYNVIQYIFDAATNPENRSRRYFFITTLKKNLPIEDLRSRFENAGRLQDFEEKFLFIDSNIDTVIDNLTETVKQEIPNEIKKTDEYKEFSKAIELLQNQDKNSELRAFAASIKNTLMKTGEPNFRRMIEKLLAKEFSTVDERLTAIKTTKKWRWLGSLYPSVFSRDRQIFFLSVDKFLARNSTIVEPSYMFYNSDLIKDSIIFIDEFDATKDTVLKNIIQNGLRDRIDYIDLFSAIYSSMQTAVFPAALTTPSKQRKEGQYANQSLQSVVDGIKEKAEVIFNDYSLALSHRTVQSTDNASSNFLFQDHQFLSVLNGNKSYITTKRDDADRINTIEFTSEKPNSDSNNIQVLLGKLRGFVSWFEGAVNILAINYLQRKKEMHRDGEDEFTFEAALSSVIALFRLSPEYSDFIKAQILTASHRQSGNINGPEFDQSLYENGFRYYAFEDENAHDMQSKIMVCSFQNTPEKTLLRFCEKAKVIGISATATIDTVVGNYDLSYLKVKMQDAYEELSDIDYKRLSEDFYESQKGYKNINIHTELIGDSDYAKYSKASWLSVFSNEELATLVFDRLETETNDSNNYHQERYLRIALAYKKFLCTDDIKSFLCVLTKHPRKGDPYLNLNTLFELFDYIAEDCQSPIRAKHVVAQLDGDEYDSKKNTVIRRLESGEKLFVISVYQTIGAGQNLQYKVPSDLLNKMVKVNNRKGSEKDFDAIYLDKPTNLLVQLSAGLEEEDFVKYIFQTEFLQENAEISVYDARKHIRNAFKTISSNGLAARDFATSLYDTKSIKMLSTRFIIQAIGRICRTSIKNPNIYILADSRISEAIDTSIDKKRILNHEFQALLKLIKQNGIKSPLEKSLEDSAFLKSAKVNKDIRNMLEEDWNDRRIQKWRSLRDLVLRYPTMTSEDVQQNFIAWNYYIEQPSESNRYYYHQEEDYNQIKISFTPTNDCDMTVCEEKTNLNRLMSFSDIRGMFVQSGFATTFAPNAYIMSPPLWNNVYKGALGEVVGKYIFEKELGIELEEIEDPDIFELFDYKVKNAPVFVDFKNWKDSTDFNWENQINKITRKATRCGCECVIIANILTDRSRYSIRMTNRSGVKILVVPALLLMEPEHDVCVENCNKIKDVVYGYTDQNE